MERMVPGLATEGPMVARAFFKFFSDWPLITSNVGENHNNLPIYHIFKTTNQTCYIAATKTTDILRCFPLSWELGYEYHDCFL